MKCSQIYIGCEAKVFLSRKRKIVKSKIVHPDQSDCRQLLADNIGDKLRSLRDEGKFALSFSSLAKISGKVEHSFGNVIFNCKVDGYHDLSNRDNKKINKILTNFDTIIKMLDCVLGNTCVLIDRNRKPGKNRAGSFKQRSKLSKKVFEYRALSNFWLRSYPLMSLVFGLGRFAINILMAGKESKILDCVNIDDIRKAIDENDFDLAWKNFKKMEPAILKLAGKNGRFPLKESNIENFYKFIKRISKSGIQSVCPKDPLKHWSKQNNNWENYGPGPGWERYISRFNDKKS